MSKECDAPQVPAPIPPTAESATAAPEREAKYRKAKQALVDLGWAFDDFVSVEMRRVLNSDPNDMTTREVAYNRARVATEVKAGLSSLVDEYEADE